MLAESVGGVALRNTLMMSCSELALIFWPHPHLLLLWAVSRWPMRAGVLMMRAGMLFYYMATSPSTPLLRLLLFLHPRLWKTLQRGRGGWGASIGNRFLKIVSNSMTGRTCGLSDGTAGSRRSTSTSEPSRSCSDNTRTLRFPLRPAGRLSDEDTLLWELSDSRWDTKHESWCGLLLSSTKSKTINKHFC